MKIQDAPLPTDQGDTPSKQECEFVPEGIIINEVQLLLAEKRTSLSTMRTGIAVFVLPLSVLSVLIATSKYYNVLQVMPLIIPLFIICVLLVFLGSYLIIRAMIRMRHQDSLILQLKRKHRWIAEYID
jgi:uncharacterized membrane protein YdbT with pleckstrin-like domain